MPISEPRIVPKIVAVTPAQSDVRDVAFRVLPEDEGWGVSIDGVPDPGIVHDRPWPTVDSARDAAVSAIEAMLVLERVQILEEQKGLDAQPPEGKTNGESN